MIRFHFTKAVESPEGPLTLDFQAELEGRSAVALFGASGCGKTTLLRMLAGLTRPDGGFLEVDGVTWFDAASRFELPCRRRRVGFVFQDYALFPTMTVRQNLSYAQEKGAKASEVDALLELMELNSLAGRFPATLSGGQRQRVALARALIRKPELLLLDEPLSALDPAMRRKLQEELIRIQRAFEVTTVLVSHDPGEIARTCQKVFCLERGGITREGSPVEIFSGGHFSGKFRFQAEVLCLEACDIVVVASLLVGSEVVKVALLPEEAEALEAGDRVTVASKAFNPVLWKEPRQPS